MLCTTMALIIPAFVNSLDPRMSPPAASPAAVNCQPVLQQHIQQQQQVLLIQQLMGAADEDTELWHHTTTCLAPGAPRVWLTAIVTVLL